MKMTGPHPEVLEGYAASSIPGRLQLAAQAATFQNDNAAPHCGALPVGARVLVLSQAMDTADQPILMIRILLDDGSFMPALYVARDSFEVIALWKGFGRDLNLPLGMLDESGAIIAVSHAPGEQSYARRGGSPLTHRRTRTASKRQVPLMAWSADALISPLSA